MKFLPIEKENIPYRFSVRIQGETFEFEVHYNAEYDFFTVDLYRDGEALAYGEKVIYGKALFSSYAKEGYPKVALIPFDLAENETRVSYDNLMETVFIYMFEREDFDDAELDETS